MQTRDMRRMANQVAAFFAAYPPDEAIDGVARHLQSFWDPRMRRKLLEDYAANQGEGLLPLARQAVERLAGKPN